MIIIAWSWIKISSLCWYIYLLSLSLRRCWYGTGWEGWPAFRLFLYLFFGEIPEGPVGWFLSCPNGCFLKVMSWLVGLPSYSACMWSHSWGYQGEYGLSCFECNSDTLLHASVPSSPESVVWKCILTCLAVSETWMRAVKGFGWKHVTVGYQGICFDFQLLLVI